MFTVCRRQAMNTNSTSPAEGLPVRESTADRSGKMKMATPLLNDWSCSGNCASSPFVDLSHYFLLGSTEIKFTLSKKPH